jgi:hypothetical protein
MPGPPTPESIFHDQLEWLSHRYDPGHYLGGTIRPELRLSLGVKAKRVAAALALVSALAALGLLLTSWIASRAFVPEPWSLSLGVLGILVARRLWTSAATDGVSSTEAIADGMGRLVRVVGMTLLAAFCVALGVLALILLYGGVVALFRGQTGVATAASLLLALALLHRWRSAQE